MSTFFRFINILTSILFCFVSISTFSQVRLPRLISDGMVLQRDKPIKIWGWASANEVVVIRFNGQNYTTKTNNNKHWQLMLPGMKAGGPYQMDIRGKNNITIKNILLGDVWICSGQSNMEFDMSRVKDKYAAEIASSTNLDIRQFFVNHQWNFKAQDDVQSNGWLSADPKTIYRFTAVGYFFARQLYEKYHIPIGLINTSVGGSPAEAWTSTEGLKELPTYLEQIKPYQDSLNVKEIQQHDKLITSNWYKQIKAGDKGFLNPSDLWKTGGLDPSGWGVLTIPGIINNPELKGFAGILWLKRVIDIPEVDAGKDAIIQLGNFSDQDTTYINGQKVGYTSNKHLPRQYTIASSLLKTGINIIVIRLLINSGPGSFYEGKPYQLNIGNTVISLQGEWKYKVGVSVDPFPTAKLVNFAYQPTVLYNSMIAPLLGYGIKGIVWYQGEANTTKAYAYRPLFRALISDWRSQFNQGDFPFLFVQLANLRAKPKLPTGSSWAELREAQAMALTLPNTAMAVAHDIGEWNDIHPLNKLDLGKRLALAAQKVAYGDKAVIYSGPTYQSMKVQGSQCTIQFTNIGTGLTIKGSDKLSQFAIAGANQKFVWANARIDGDNVIIWSESVPEPVAVRYAWSDNPEDANLYNREGLPAVSFRTDSWAGLTFGK